MIEAEEREFARAASQKQVGMRAFIGKQALHSGATIALYGPDETKHWTPLVICYGADHRERAAAFVDRFNQL